MTKKMTRQAALLALILVPLFYFQPTRIVGAVLLLCGLYDVLRNSKRDLSVILQYFTGNGFLTWLLSPLNVLFDILALPYINKGVYKLADLPPAYQDEIQHLIQAAHKECLVEKLEEKTKDNPRSMVFFKWYGSNVKTFIDIPAFHQEYKYIKTIGVSVFNKKKSTSRHFGPFRASFRVLYNVNTMHDHSAYIEVGSLKSYWREDKLFIFDDTLIHQSFNESDQVRYCLFVDILRPSKIPFFFNAIMHFVRFTLKGYNYVFYKNWEVIKQ